MLREKIVGFTLKTLVMMKQLIQPKVAIKKTRQNIKKKSRRSSVRKAEEIRSMSAEKILEHIKNDTFLLLKKNDEIEGKKSLACLVWALGHAERAKVENGISIHDVSALLYRTQKIELYPINISRVLSANSHLVKLQKEDKKTKTYVLSDEGKKVFEEKFIAKDRAKNQV